MYLQLTAIVADLHSAERRLSALRAALPVEKWNVRPGPEHWSPAECVAHLNLTSEAFLPRLREGIAQAGRLNRRTAARWRRDLTGWLIWRLVTPTGRFRTKTVAGFVPAGDQPADVLIQEFGRLQAALIALVQQCDGLPIDRVKIVSPFDSRAKYNVYASLTIIPRHQHRHLLQAERAGGVAAARGTAAHADA